MAGRTAWGPVDAPTTSAPYTTATGSRGHTTLTETTTKAGLDSGLDRDLLCSTPRLPHRHREGRGPGSGLSVGLTLWVFNTINKVASPSGGWGFTTPSVDTSPRGSGRPSTVKGRPKLISRETRGLLVPVYDPRVPSSREWRVVPAEDPTPVGVREATGSDRGTPVDEDEVRRLPTTPGHSPRSVHDGLVPGPSEQGWVGLGPRPFATGRGGTRSVPTTPPWRVDDGPHGTRFYGEGGGGVGVLSVSGRTRWVCLPGPRNGSKNPRYPSPSGYHCPGWPRNRTRLMPCTSTWL